MGEQHNAFVPLKTGQGNATSLRLLEILSAHLALQECILLMVFTCSGQGSITGFIFLLLLSSSKDINYNPETGSRDGTGIVSKTVLSSNNQVQSFYWQVINNILSGFLF